MSVRKAKYEVDEGDGIGNYCTPCLVRVFGKDVDKGDFEAAPPNKHCDECVAREAGVHPDAKKTRPRVVIFMANGLLEAVYCDVDVEVMKIDRDDDADDKEIRRKDIAEVNAAMVRRAFKLRAGEFETQSDL